MSNLQKNPLKLYIQDIFRANRTPENKYIYEIFGLNFKNIMIHGVVTSVYNKTSTSTNLELSDATGSVQIYFDTKKTNLKTSDDAVKNLYRHLADRSQFNDENIDIMTTMLNAIAKKTANPIDFEEGSYVSVVGDIFIDDLRDIRMVSAYSCNVTCVERDVVWLEELRYLYDKFYLWNKEENVGVKDNLN